MSIKREGNYLIEYTDGEENKCYTCGSRTFRGARRDIDFCTMKQTTLSSQPEQGCESGWSRRYKRVY